MIKWRIQLLTSIEQPNTSSSAKYAKLLHEKEKKKKKESSNDGSSQLKGNGQGGSVWYVQPWKFASLVVVLQIANSEMGKYRLVAPY